MVRTFGSLRLLLFLLAAAGMIAPCGIAGEKATPLNWLPEQMQAVREAVVTVEPAPAAKDGAAPASGTVHLRFDNPEWSAGLRLVPPAGSGYWNFSMARVFAVDVENLSPNRQMRLTMHLSSGKREKRGSDHVSDIHHGEVNTGIGLNPGEKRSMRILLPHMFLRPANTGIKGWRMLDTSHLNAIEFQMQWPFEAPTKDLVNCRLSNFRLEGSSNAERKSAVTAEKFYPFIDAYGQYIHGDWPEKIHNDAALTAAYEKELKTLRTTRGPKSWTRFGGWADGPQLEATGSFRVEKYEGKWYFVDPEGRLFFSFGVDVLRDHTDAISGKHPEWFTTPVPPDNSMPFTKWNLEKKYGSEDYKPMFYAVQERRMRNWGMNTIGNWSAKELMMRSRTPYTLGLSEFNSKRWPSVAGSKLKFYDPFDFRFEERMGNILRDRAREDEGVEKSLTDPMCIGYFIDNELNFNGYVREIVKAQPTQPGKIEFVRMLRKKYASLNALNNSWNSGFSEWSSILENTREFTTEGFRRDCREFQALAWDKYFAVCREGIKSAAPARLYLGCRFVGFRQPADLWAAAAKHCDVISVNCYTNSVDHIITENFHDRPVLIGEFHFGTIDRGMFSAGLCPGGITQEERATAFLRFVQGALVNPSLVGCHWFQFRDQPLTGRWDGEGYQIGFVDVADTPYPAMTRTAREIGENMYQYRKNGKLVNSMATAKTAVK